MSSRAGIIEDAYADGRATMLLWGLVAIGSLALVARRQAIGSPDATRVFVLTLSMLGLASIAIPVRHESGHHLNPALVVCIGVAAFAAASLLIGSQVPLAHAPEMLVLNSLAAVSEEAFFRRLVYGGLIRHGAIVAVAGSALLFALVHVPLYGPGVFWVDLGAGLILSWQRMASGSWGTSAATHVWANLLVVLR